MLEKNDVEGIKQLSPILYLNSDANGDTLLMRAINLKNEEIVNYLLSLEEKPFLNCTNVMKENALFCAIYEQNENLALRLIELGINVNQINLQGFTPLIFACSFNLPKVVDALLKLGVDVNQRSTPFGTTALTHAAINGMYDTVVALLTYGADKNNVDMYGMTPSNWASFQDYKEISKFIEQFPKIGAC